MLLSVTVTSQNRSTMSLSNSSAGAILNTDPLIRPEACAARIAIESTGPPGGCCLAPDSNVARYHSRQIGGITSNGRPAGGTDTPGCSTEILALTPWSSIRLL